MKTGKRFLSVLLAVLMLASCLVFAFAEEKEEEALYVTYKLPYFETWNSVYAEYQQPSDFDIRTYKGWDFNDFEFDPPTDPDVQIPSYLLVRADYNSPFYLYVVDNNGVKHKYELKGFQYSSCKTATSGSYYCVDVDCQQTLSVTFPAEHIFTDVITRRNASCTEGEIRSRYCARCNAVQTVTGEPWGHNYEKGKTVAATCFTDGYTPYICSRCKKVQMTDIKPADPKKHKDDNGDNHCDVCGTLMNKPSESESEKPAEQKAEKQNIFQRIIEWFKNLFSKLFK